MVCIKTNIWSDSLVAKNSKTPTTEISQHEFLDNTFLGDFLFIIYTT